MAILRRCPCGAEFGCSASSGRYLCRKCDGTEAAEKAEDERWAALTTDEKLNELRDWIMDLIERVNWDGRIG